MGRMGVYLMNKKQILQIQKKRLPHYLPLSQDAMYVGDDLGKDLYFTTNTMWKVSLTGAITKVPQNTNWTYYHSSLGILNNFYYSVRHIITLLNGVRRSRTRPCGRGF